MEKFTVDNEYLTGVTVKFGYTECNSDFSIIYSVDHPAFQELRKHLGYRNLIKIEERWLNGDRVLEDFMFNDIVFRTNDKFPCASAMKLHLKFK